MVIPTQLHRRPAAHPKKRPSCGAAGGARRPYRRGNGTATWRREMAAPWPSGGVGRRPKNMMVFGLHGERAPRRPLAMGWRRASVLVTTWCPLSKWRRRRQCRRCHQAASQAKAKKGTAATDPVGHLARPLRPPLAAGTVPPTPRRRLRTFVPHGPRRRGSICLCAESQMADPHLPRPQLPTAAHAATRCPAHIV